MGLLASLAALAAFSGGAQTMDLNQLASKAVNAALAKFASKQLKPDEIGVSVTVLDTGTKSFRSGSYRGDDEMYPASVVKLFYITYLAHLLETGKLKSTPEIERATHDMIVESDNDATNWILELITGAASGPELSPRALKGWMDKRQAVNRWFRTLGYKKVNACQKTWYSGPYGRESQGYGKDFALRNSLTPNECARLMSEIMLDKVVTPARCEWMRGFLHRLPPSETKQPNDQASDFTGKILPMGWKLWSKAGWTSTARHDIAAVEAPDGKRFVIVVFTKNHANDAGIIQTAASVILEGFGYTPLPVE